MSRQRLVLLGLAAVLAVSLLYAFWAMPRQEKAPPRAPLAKPAVSTVKPGKPVSSGKLDKQPIPASDRLQLELLNQELRKFPGASRDIFRFAGGRAPLVVEAESVMPEPPPAPPLPPPTPEEILRDSLKNITFLGFLDKRGTRTVFLSLGDEVFLVKAGERFGRQKELVAREITARQLVVGWEDGPETVKVQLLENEKLRPAGISGGVADKGQVSAPPGVSAGSARPHAVAPRRLLMPQRTPAGGPPPEEEPPPEEPVVEADDEPIEEVSQEELLKQGLPSGE